MQEVKATYASALERMKEFDDFKFTSTSTLFFEWIEGILPEMFVQILYLILCRALAGLGEEDGVRGLRTLQSYPAGLAVRLSAGKAEKEERKRRNQKIW